MRLSCLISYWAVCLGLLTGCIEIHQAYSLNPDGSGKLLLTLIYDPKANADLRDDEVNLAEEGPQAEMALRDLADEIVATAQGVEAWTDYQMKHSPNGKMALSITGYFPDINAFQLSPPSDEGLPCASIKCTPLSSSDSRYEVILKSINDSPPILKKPTLTNVEAQERREESRIRMNAEALESRMLYEPMKLVANFHLPGQVKSNTNIEKRSARETQLTVSGKRLLKLMEDMVRDDALANQVFNRGWTFGDPIALPGEVVNERLFGERAPIAFDVTPNQRPLFNYAKELERAKRHPPPIPPE